MIVSLVVAVLITLYILEKKYKYVTVYEGSESTLKEAMEYYWALKAHRLPIKYKMPYNFNNLYRFGYVESPVRIDVRKQDEAKARELLMNFRAEKRKMERNIEESRKRGTPAGTVFNE